MGDEELFIEEDGGVLCTCTICEAEIWAEPDATKAWCDYCNAEVHVKNPLIEAGLI